MIKGRLVNKSQLNNIKLAKIQEKRCSLAQVQYITADPVADQLNTCRQRQNTCNQGRIYVANESYLCDNHVDSWSKTKIFTSNYLECKTKSVCFDENHANFRLKSINY